MYTKMKSGGFGLCYHREEITFQLKTTTLFGVGGHTGQAGNSSFKNTSGQHTPALLPEEMVPPPTFSPATSLLILAQFVSGTDRGTTSS